MNSYELLKTGNQIDIENNLSLQLIRKQDFDEIVTMLDNPNVSKYLFFAPSPVEVYESYFFPIIEDIEKSIIKNNWAYSLTLIARNSKLDFIGMVGLVQNPFVQGNYEIGYQLPEKSWRKGIATKLSEFAINLAFNELKAYKIIADCYADNIGSIKIMQKIGLEFEGKQKDFYKLKGKKDDKVLFGLTSSQFKKKEFNR